MKPLPAVDLQALTQRWALSVGDPAALAAGDPTQTYRRDVAPGAQVDGLARGGDFDLERQIAQGGMASIWQAGQRSLDRDIAVKVPLAPAGYRPLVAEALVTGALERPNVIPVHGLSIGDGGAPQLSMKLVRGTAWTERLV
jgi:hypothetical protein